jgi:hypothetical protein
MKKVLFILGIFLISGVFVISNYGVAEEVEVEVVGEYSFGRVIAVTESQIIVKEYDYSSEEDVEVVYIITSETVLINVETYVELLIGDDVEIDYKDSNGQKIAMVIAKELLENTEDTNEYEEDNWEDNEGESYYEGEQNG